MQNSEYRIQDGVSPHTPFKCGEAATEILYFVFCILHFLTIPSLPGLPANIDNLSRAMVY